MMRERRSLGYRRASHFDVNHHALGTRAVELYSRRQFIAFCVRESCDFYSPDATRIYKFLRERSLRSSNNALRLVRNGLRAYFLRLQAQDPMQDIALHFGQDDVLQLAVRPPMTLAQFGTLLSPIGDTEPFDLRDRALMTLLVTGLASSESLRILRGRDVVFTKDGAFFFTEHPLLRVTRLRAIAGPLCIIRALKRWMAFRIPGPDDYVFAARGQRGELKTSRLGESVISGILFRLAQQSGLDPARYGTRGLRRHFTFETLCP